MRAVKDVNLPSFRIVKYAGSHASNCVGDINFIDHPLLTSDFVSTFIENIVRADPSLKIKVIVQLISQEFHFTITYKRAWLGKQKAITKIFGDWEKSFEELPRYLQAMKQSNVGTVVHWCTTQSVNPSVHVFKRVFWAFKPSIDGFRYCRPLITIDGTHLYGKYKGTLLIAMATDANFQLFPLAFAIVEEESGESWPWFMACIRQSVTQRPDLCVISDRHLGIIKAMTESGSGWEEPFAHHRYCIRHLASNVNSTFRNSHVKNLFGRAADSRQKKKFDMYFDKLGELCPDSRRYLQEIPLHKWSIYHDGGFRFGIRTTNMSEVFNGVLKGARSLPIKALVEMTFYRVNSYFVSRRELGQKRLAEGHEYTPTATITIEKNIQKAAAHEVTPFNYELGLYEVKTGRGSRPPGKGGNVHSVNLSRKTCTCEKYKIDPSSQLW